jgi:CTP:molybdopterin cytidylyltransferase MocA
VAFDGSLLARLRRLQGDEGARRLLRDPSVAVYRLTTDDEGVCFDVDTPADARRWRDRVAGRTPPAGPQPP